MLVRNTLVTYTDKKTLNNADKDPIFSFKTPIFSCSIYLDWTPNTWQTLLVPSLVTHPDNPWFQVLSCTFGQTLTTPSPVTCSCHMPLSHTIVTHPQPSTRFRAGTSTTLGTLGILPHLSVLASTNTQWTSGHPPIVIGSVHAIGFHKPRL